MINIRRSIPWAFRITLHTAPVPFLATVCTALPAGLDAQLDEQWGGVGLSDGQW